MPATVALVRTLLVLTAVAIAPAAALPTATPDACGVLRSQRDNDTNPELEACAARGDPEAQAWLGIWYLGAESGDTELSDAEREAEGLRLIQQAAQGGNGAAQNELGLAYLNGEFGLSADPTEALRWFGAADAAGDMIAPYNLARVYFSGRGVRQSFMRGEAYLRASAERGYKPARCSLALLVERRRGGGAEASALRALAALSDFDLPCAEHDIMAELPDY
jgi:TPR repeat protein